MLGHVALSEFHSDISHLLSTVDIPSAWQLRAQQLSHWLQQHIDQDGLDRWLQRLITALLPRVDKLTATRLQQLLRATTSCLTQHPELSLSPDRLAAHVQHIKLPKNEITPDIVECLTIHSSKGLEYDIVVLPQLGFSLRSKDHQDSILARREHPADLAQAIVPRPLKATKPLFPTLSKVADQHDQEKREEDLCLLYVAMTRAKHGLELILPPEPQTDRKQEFAIQTWADILKQTLLDPEPSIHREPTTDQSLQPDLQPLTHWGTAAWSTSLTPLSRPHITEPTPLNLHLLSGVPARRFRPVLTPSSSHQTPHSARELLTGNQGMTFGTLVHELCERIHWIDEQPAPLAMIRQQAFASNSAMAQQAVNMVQNFLTSSAAQSLYRRGADELWRERPFLLMDHGQSIHGCFDRVLIWRNAQGDAQQALIQDFKTDHLPTDADQQIAITTYRPQLAVYRRALASMLGMSEQHITAELILLGTATCQPVAFD